MRRVVLLLLLYRRSLQTYKRPIGRLSLCITCYRRAAMNAPQVCGVVRDQESGELYVRTYKKIRAA